MVTRGSGNYQDLDKTQVKLFPNFTSIPFDYLLISWVTNYVSNRGFLTCLSWIVSIDRELHFQTFRAKIWLKFSEFFDNIPLRILLDVLFRVFRFSKASFLCPDIFIHDIWKLRRYLGMETYVRLPWQFSNFTCEITN